MRMINMVLGQFGLRLASKLEDSVAESIHEVERKISEQKITALGAEIEELRERNRELLKRVARHSASVYYYKKSYRLLKGKEVDAP